MFFIYFIIITNFNTCDRSISVESLSVTSVIWDLLTHRSLKASFRALSGLMMQPSSTETPVKMLPSELAEVRKSNLCFVTEQIKHRPHVQGETWEGKRTAGLHSAASFLPDSTQMAICVCVSVVFTVTEDSQVASPRGTRRNLASETSADRAKTVRPVTAWKRWVDAASCDCAGAPPVRSLAPPRCRGVVVCRAAKRHSALPYGNGRHIQGRTPPRLLAPEGCLCCCSSHAGWQRGGEKDRCKKNKQFCVYLSYYYYYAGKTEFISRQNFEERKLTSALILLHKCSVCRWDGAAKPGVARPFQLISMDANSVTVAFGP